MQQVVLLSLKNALLKYPELKTFVVSKYSAMSLIISEKHKHSRIQTMIVLEKGQPAAWAWLFRMKRYGSPYNFMVYVPPVNRGKKLGTLLYNACKKISKRRKAGMNVFPWDSKSISFYKNMDIKNSYKKIF